MQNITKYIAAFLSATSLALGMPAAAQDGSKIDHPLDDQSEKDDLEKRVKDQFGTVSNSGPLDRDGAAAQSEQEFATKLQIGAIDEAVSATFNAALTRGNINVTRIIGTNDYKIVSKHHQLSLSAAVPINETGDAAVADFQRIGNDASLDLSYTFFSMSRRSGGGYNNFLIQFARACVIDAFSKWRSSRFDQFKDADEIERDAILNAFDNFINSGGARSWAGAVKEGANKTDAKTMKLLAPNLGPVVLANCSLGADNIKNNGDLERKFASVVLSRDQYSEFKEQYFGSANLIFGGASAELGFEKFGILDRPNFLISDIDRVGFDLSAYIGTVGKNGDWSARMSGGFSRGFEATDVVEFCRMVQSSQDQTCISGQDGTPDRKDSSYIKVEGRFVLHRNQSGAAKFAIAPEFAFDFEEDNLIVDVPIYLQQSESTGLDGGIRVAYETKDSEFGIGVFVGIPFSTWF